MCTSPTPEGSRIEGGLPTRITELIALVVGVGELRDGCVADHARAAAAAGASEEEVAEALGVAPLMNGGPASVWARRAFATFWEFSQTSRRATA